MYKQWERTIKEVDGEYIIELPDDLLEYADLKVGDQIDWIDNKDGSFTLSKVKEVNVLVETIQQYRMRYVIKCPVDNPQYALDTIYSGEHDDELTQKDLGQVVVSYRVVTSEEIDSIKEEDK